MQGHAGLEGKNLGYLKIPGTQCPTIRAGCVESPEEFPVMNQRDSKCALLKISALVAGSTLDKRPQGGTPRTGQLPRLKPH